MIYEARPEELRSTPNGASKPRWRGAPNEIDKRCQNRESDAKDHYVGNVCLYLMYRRGESIPSIAKQTVTNPVGSLVTEVQNAV